MQPMKPMPGRRAEPMPGGRVGRTNASKAAHPWDGGNIPNLHTSIHVCTKPEANKNIKLPDDADSSTPSQIIQEPSSSYGAYGNDTHSSKYG